MIDSERDRMKARTAIDRVVNGNDLLHRAAEVMFGELVAYIRCGNRALRLQREDGGESIILKRTIDIARLDSPIYLHRSGQFSMLVKEIVSINRMASHLYVENVFNSGLERHLKNNGWRVTFCDGFGGSRSYCISVAEAKQRYCVESPVHVERAPLTLEVAKEDLPSVRETLNRAMNTWEPSNWPSWLRDLDGLVDQAMSKHFPPKVKQPQPPVRAQDPAPATGENPEG